MSATQTITKAANGSKRVKQTLNLSSLKDAIQSPSNYTANINMDTTIDESADESPRKHKQRKVGVKSNQ